MIIVLDSVSHVLRTTGAKVKYKVSNAHVIPAVVPSEKLGESRLARNVQRSANATWDTSRIPKQTNARISTSAKDCQTSAPWERVSIPSEVIDVNVGQEDCTIQRNYNAKTLTNAKETQVYVSLEHARMLMVLSNAFATQDIQQHPTESVALKSRGIQKSVISPTLMEDVRIQVQDLFPNTPAVAADQTMLMETLVFNVHSKDQPLTVPWVVQMIVVTLVRAEKEKVASVMAVT